jgi:hypothetical protein
LEGSARGLMLRYSPGIRLEGLRKTTKKPLDSRSLGREPTEYEAGVLTSRPRLQWEKSLREGPDVSFHTSEEMFNARVHTSGPTISVT